MKKFLLLSLTVLLCGAFFVLESYSLEVDGEQLVKLGTGTRTEYRLRIYTADLWIPPESKGNTAKQILEADEPSVVVLKVVSGMITTERFVNAIYEGFQKAAVSGYKTDKHKQFLDLFETIDLNRGDRCYIKYIPGTGVTVKAFVDGNEETYGPIPGLEFKQALYAIWIGPEPVQTGLKNGMLGK